jgi:hypothetical protein
MSLMFLAKAADFASKSYSNVHTDFTVNGLGCSDDGNLIIYSLRKNSSYPVLNAVFFDGTSWVSSSLTETGSTVSANYFGQYRIAISDDYQDIVLASGESNGIYFFVYRFDTSTKSLVKKQTIGPIRPNYAGVVNNISISPDGSYFCAAIWEYISGTLHKFSSEWVKTSGTFSENTNLFTTTNSTGTEGCFVGATNSVYVGSAFSNSIRKYTKTSGSNWSNTVTFSTPTDYDFAVSRTGDVLVFDPYYQTGQTKPGFARVVNSNDTTLWTVTGDFPEFKDENFSYNASMYGYISSDSKLVVISGDKGVHCFLRSANTYNYIAKINPGDFTNSINVAVAQGKNTIVFAPWGGSSIYVYRP